MEPRANYFTVGLFMVALMGALVAGIIWFTASQHKKHNTYLVYMQESVSGLSEQAAVKFNGVEIGFVSEMDLNPQNPQQVILTLSIEAGTPIDQSTRATLMTQGITGVMFVGLKAGSPDAPPLTILPGNRYPIIASEPSLLETLGDILKDVGGNFKKISGGFEQLLDQNNQRAIKNTLANLDTITGTLAGNSKELAQTIKNLEATLSSSQVVLGSFSQQLMPSMVQSMNRLSAILNNVEPLTSGLKDNPSMLIRGKAPAAPGPGE